MAKKVINAPFVDYGGHKYEPGEEDALAAVLPKRDIEIFVEKGLLTGDWSGSGELPAVADLEDHLQTLGSVEEVQALQQRDTRKSTEKLYKARITELEGQG